MHTGYNDVPGGEAREGHAYHENYEFIIALSGSFDVVVDNGLKQTTYSLNRSYYGLLLPAGYWRTLTNFSTNSLAFILASTPYNPDDYILNYSNSSPSLQNEKIPQSTTAQ